MIHLAPKITSLLEIVIIHTKWYAMIFGCYHIHVCGTCDLYVTCVSLCLQRYINIMHCDEFILNAMFVLDNRHVHDIVGCVI